VRSKVGGARAATGGRSDETTAPSRAQKADGAPRVLHVITTLDRGGAEKALLALCRARAAHTGPDRTAVAYLKGAGELASEFRAAGVAVHDLAVRGIRAARARSAFESVRRRFAPDVVHSHLFKADVLAAACLGRHREGREALVSTKHNVDVYLAQPVWRVLGRSALSRADACIAISAGVESHLRATVGAPACGIDVVPYGVEVPAPPVVDPPGQARLLCIGRLEPQKAPISVLEAFRRVHAAGPATLAYLGRGSLEANLRAAAGSLPEGAVEFLPFAADPLPHIDAADVVVLGSRWEGLGLALVEAALRERPVVATNVGGIPEVVEDGVTGLLVPPRAPAEMSAAILRLLGDPALARRMGRAAAERARRQFDLGRCVAAHETLYARAMRGCT
jgi:glycosyltransferase involved in cell wall biosynthesis